MASRRDDSRTVHRESNSDNSRQSDSSGHAANQAVGNPAEPKTYFSEEELDKQFADRFTESDPEFMSVMDSRKEPFKPPVVPGW
jgi:hypothetical protein